MIYLFTISLILFSLSDWLIDGKLEELGKLGFVLTMFCIMLIPFDKNMIIAWFILHYPVHQVSQGLLRHKNPLYLGTGYFDKLIYICTGGAWWMYALTLAAALFVGIHLMI